MASLVTELLMVEQGQFIVRASVQIGGLTLATGMASAPTVEAAEDQARIRSIKGLGFTLGAGIEGMAGGMPISSMQIPQVPMPQSRSPLTMPTASPSQATPPETGSEAIAPFPASSPLQAPPSTMTKTIPPVTSPSGSSAEPVQFPSPIADLYSHVIADTDSEEMEAVPLPMDKLRPASELMNGGDRKLSSPQKQGDRPTPAKTPPSEPEPIPSEPPADDSGIDLSDIIAQIDVEMSRLGWTKRQGRDYLKRTYGKATRSELEVSELYNFLHYLEAQPMPG